MKSWEELTGRDNAPGNDYIPLDADATGKIREQRAAILHCSVSLIGALGDKWWKTVSYDSDRTHGGSPRGLMGFADYLADCLERKVKTINAAELQRHYQHYAGIVSALEARFAPGAAEENRKIHAAALGLAAAGEGIVHLIAPMMGQAAERVRPAAMTHTSARSRTALAGQENSTARVSYDKSAKTGLENLLKPIFAACNQLKQDAEGKEVEINTLVTALLECNAEISRKINTRNNSEEGLTGLKKKTLATLADLAKKAAPLFIRKGTEDQTAGIAIAAQDLRQQYDTFFGYMLAPESLQSGLLARSKRTGASQRG